MLYGSTKLVFSNLNISQAWRLWWAGAGLVVAIHCLTLRISPTVWQDEVQIVDYGRATVFERGTDWSINWHPQGRPIPVLAYLGPALQESAYRLSGGSMLGPRVASLVGAVFAGSMALGWLAARGTIPAVALAGAALLLLDPSFTQGYRGARVDCWAIGFCLAAAWSLRAARQPERCGRHAFRAGLCAGVGGLIWPSVVFLGPLLLAEGWAAVRQTPAPDRWRTACRGAVLFAVGAVGLFVVALIPFQAELRAMVADLFSISRSGLNLSSGGSHPRASQLGVFWQSLQLGPWLFVLALPAWLVRRDCGLGLGLAVAVAITLATNAYVHRVVYLLPYALGLVTGAASEWSTRPVARWVPWVVRGGLTAMLGWGVVLTLVLRPWLALGQAEGRNPAVLVEAATRALGRTHAAVYVSPWEFYYAGRQLGWRQYKLPFVPEEPSSPGWTNLLRRMDYVIFAVSELTAGRRAALAQAGFDPRGRYPETAEPPRGRGWGKGGRPYGPVEVFARRAEAKPHE